MFHNIFLIWNLSRKKLLNRYFCIFRQTDFEFANDLLWEPFAFTFRTFYRTKFVFGTWNASSAIAMKTTTKYFIDINIFIESKGVRLILRSKLGKMTVNEKRPEMLPAIA